MQLEKEIPGLFNELGEGWVWACEFPLTGQALSFYAFGTGQAWTFQCPYSWA